ncbi:hypothetical protein SEUCBS139899_010668 [Sporothrix eucalyptigena]|uniref:CBM1 domain-containing protein n=1 Tax=Sporothrix eucalyptigena TaxID=1812306 RepID=A0ABP0CE43_9PEZI
MAPKALLPMVLLASAAAAQRSASVWSQCGGSAFAGPTACAAGNYCSYGNPWYSQCLPGTPDDPLDSNVPDSPLETNTAQIIITIGGGSNSDPPIVVTTAYTYLLPSTTIYAHHSTPTPAPAPAPSNGGDGGPQLTIIGGTTYTIIRDPPATGNNKRTAAVPAVAPRATTLYNDGRPLVQDENLEEKPTVLATPTAKWTTIVTVAEKRT